MQSSFSCCQVLGRTCLTELSGNSRSEGFSNRLDLEISCLDEPYHLMQAIIQEYMLLRYARHENLNCVIKDVSSNHCFLRLKDASLRIL